MGGPNPDQGPLITKKERIVQNLGLQVVSYVREHPQPQSLQKHIAEIKGDFQADATDDQLRATYIFAQAMEQLQLTGEASRWLYIPITNSLQEMKVDALIIPPDNHIAPIQIGSKQSKMREIISMYGDKPPVSLVSSRDHFGIFYDMPGIVNQIRYALRVQKRFTVAPR